MSASTKVARVLECLANGRSINRFEAERELHDHVLPSTISRIQSLGIYVDRWTEKVLGYGGNPTYVSRYQILMAVDREKARKALMAMKGKRHGRNSGSRQNAAQRRPEGP